MDKRYRSMSPTRTYLRLSAGFLPTRSAVSVQKHCHREYRRPSFILAWVIFAAHCYNYRYTFRIVAADLSGRGLMWLKHSASCRRPMFGSLEPYRKRDSLIFWAMFIVFCVSKVYVCGFFYSQLNIVTTVSRAIGLIQYATNCYHSNA